MDLVFLSLRLCFFPLLAVRVIAQESPFYKFTSPTYPDLEDFLLELHSLNPLERQGASTLCEMATLQHVHPDKSHSGELAIRSLLNAPARLPYASAAGLPLSLGYRVGSSPLVALGALDERGRPWTTLWGAERGFARPVAQNVVGLQSVIDRRYDPVAHALLGSENATGDLIHPTEDTPQLMSGLSIDLETRDRVKLMGRMMAGLLGSRPDAAGNQGDDSSLGEAQLAMLVQESLGNCPKYLNKKAITPHLPSPKLVTTGSGLPLPSEALRLLEKADMLFLSSTDGQSMDTNHRGGPPGFVRVVNNSLDGVVLVYPEYSGNRLYQSLGNLHLNPRIGIIVPDYDTGDALYLTGTTELLTGKTAAALMPHVKMAVKITVHEVIYVKDSLAFRGASGEFSPYNPPVKRLNGEGALEAGSQGDAAPAALATLVNREQLSPTIHRFTFELDAQVGRSLNIWKPGQHVTFDFSKELDVGYSHMRDNDPQSLNDDFIRTFTISNPPEGLHNNKDEGVVVDGTKLQITAKQHGPATDLLRRQNLRAALELPVLGFGGKESFRISAGAKTGKTPVFIAGGVGITPLLAQAPRILQGATPGHGLALIWSLHIEDLPFARHVFQEITGLAERSTLFVTGADTNSSNSQKEMADEVKAMGAAVEARRMAKTDILEGDLSEKGNKFYVCAGLELQKLVMSWLANEDAISESFSY